MPEERARPSFVEPAAGPILSCMVNLLDVTGRKNERDIFISAVEKGVQDEMDEQLRVLNDKGIKDKEMRKLIMKARDESYDAVTSREKSEEALEKEQKSPIYQFGIYTTMAVMRLSRRL